MNRTILIAIALAAAATGYLYWASDERRILRLLDDVADAVSQEEATGVTGLAEVASLTQYLAPDVTLEPGGPFSAMTGAQEVVSTVGRLRAVMTTVRLEILEAQVQIDGGSASVQARTRLTMRNRDGEEIVEARDVLVTLEDRQTRWLITAARVVGEKP